jgi:hypothetical protein
MGNGSVALAARSDGPTNAMTTPEARMASRAKEPAHQRAVSRDVMR